MPLRQDLEESSREVSSNFINQVNPENKSLDDYIADYILANKKANNINFNDDVIMHFAGITNKTYLKTANSTEFDVATLDGIYESLQRKKQAPIQVKVASYTYPEYQKQEPNLVNLNTSTIVKAASDSEEKEKKAYNINFKEALVIACKKDLDDGLSKSANLEGSYLNLHSELIEDINNLRRHGVSKMDLENEVFKLDRNIDHTNHTQVINKLFDDSGEAIVDMVGRNDDLENKLQKVASKITSLTKIAENYTEAFKKVQELEKTYQEIKGSEV